MIAPFSNTIFLRCANNIVLTQYTLFDAEVIQNSILEFRAIIRSEHLHFLICLILNHHNELLDQIINSDLVR